MKDILEYIKEMDENERKICVDNCIEEFSCEFNNPSNDDEIKEFERITRCNIPKELKEFLLICNGLSFFDIGGYGLFSLNEMMEVYNTDVYLKEIYVIGSFADDYIIINSKEIDTKNYMYVTDSICPDECIKLNCNFEEFLRRFTSANFSKYWRWSVEPKYIDFSRNNSENNF